MFFKNLNPHEANLPKEITEYAQHVADAAWHGITAAIIRDCEAVDFRIEEKAAEKLALFLILSEITDHGLRIRIGPGFHIKITDN